MLVELRVENLAVVEETSVSFGPRFNAITGETGSGKSVLLAALSLCLGGKADPELVRQGESKAVVAAAFDQIGPGALAVGQDLAIQIEDQLLLSRELSGPGRTMARVNGGAVPVSALRELGENLVDLQGQGSSFHWLRELYQREALDSFGGTDVLALRQAIAELWEQRAALQTELHQLRGQRELEQGRLEQAQLDLEELNQARLSPEEDLELRRERDRLAHSSRLREAAELMRSVLAGDGASGATDQVVGAVQAVPHGVLGIDPQLDDLLDQTKELVQSLRELQLDFSSYLEKLPDDRIRLGEVEERLDLLERLIRRHGGSLAAAIARRDQAEELLGRAGEGGDRTARAKRQLGLLERQLAEACAEMSSRRQELGSRLEQEVTADLRRLLMPKAQFRVRLWQTADPEGLPSDDGRRLAPGRDGWDRVSFDLAANPGDPTRPLAEVASGGELSRVALVLLSRLARESGVGTVIFDEIDQGLGGEAANRVGDLMREVAERRQVICVTHLAAIAARADTHIRVSKREHQGRAVSVADQLTGLVRVDELARLLAGEATPGAARRHAEELLAAVGGE